NQIITPQFDVAGPFNPHTGLASAKVGGKMGFIDTSGKLVVWPQFDNTLNDREDGTQFYNADQDYYPDNGLIAVQQNGKWGFADASGSIVINPQFDAVHEFFGGNGLTPAKNGTETGFIDKT